MAKQAKVEFEKMIVTHKCRIKQYGKTAPEHASVNEVVLVPAADVNYLIGIKRVVKYSGSEEAGTIVGEKKTKKEKE